jgi:hypothetical protein
MGDPTQFGESEKKFNCETGPNFSNMEQPRVNKTLDNEFTIFNKAPRRFSIAVDEFNEQSRRGC